MRGRLVIAGAIGIAGSMVMVVTAHRLSWWCLVLTLAQATIYLACSKDRPIGWAAGLALQPPWIAYSVLTGQPSFLITVGMVTFGNVLALRRLRAADEDASRDCPPLSDHDFVTVSHDSTSESTIAASSPSSASSMARVPCVCGTGAMQ
jgi:hypothetical protein